MWRGGRRAGRETRSLTDTWFASLKLHHKGQSRDSMLQLSHLDNGNTCPVMSFPHLAVLSKWGPVPKGVLKALVCCAPVRLSIQTHRLRRLEQCPLPGNYSVIIHIRRISLLCFMYLSQLMAF